MLDYLLDPDDDHDSYDQSREEKSLNDISHFFDSILKQSFGKEKFNCELFEHCLDEIAYILNVKPLTGQLAIGERNV